MVATRGLLNEARTSQCAGHRGAACPHSNGDTRMRTQPRLDAAGRFDGGWPLAVILLAASVGASGAAVADDGSSPVMKTEYFDRDPGWEGHNNRVVPRKVPVVKQDFGYSAT